MEYEIHDQPADVRADGHTPAPGHRPGGSIDRQLWHRALDTARERRGMLIPEEEQMH